MKNLKEKIIEQLKKDGADIVCFGSIGRMKDSAPVKIMPETKTVICAAFRQLRGARRGIEEGSTYYQYTTNAVETLEETVMPLALLRACEIIENAGFEALPQRRNQLIMNSEESTNPEVDYLEIYHGKTAENQGENRQNIWLSTLSPARKTGGNIKQKGVIGLNDEHETGKAGQ